MDSEFNYDAYERDYPVVLKKKLVADGSFEKPCSGHPPAVSVRNFSSVLGV